MREGRQSSDYRQVDDDTTKAEQELIRAAVRAATGDDGQVRCRKCGGSVEQGKGMVSLMGKGVNCSRVECAGPRRQLPPEWGATTAGPAKSAPGDTVGG